MPPPLQPESGTDLLALLKQVRHVLKYRGILDPLEEENENLKREIERLKMERQEYEDGVESLHLIKPKYAA